MKEHIPKKLTSTRTNLPWFNRGLKRMCKVKRRRFKRAKKSKKSRDWERYVVHKKATASALKAVFTKKSTTATPGLFGNKYPSIGNLSITLKGVQKLLEKINISKAAGPDLIPGRMLNMLAPELAPIVHAIFT